MTSLGSERILYLNLPMTVLATMQDECDESYVVRCKTKLWFELTCSLKHRKCENIEIDCPTIEPYMWSLHRKGVVESQPASRESWSAWKFTFTRELFGL